MGRKGWIATGGMLGVVVLQLVALWRGQPSPDAAHAALAFMVGAFCGGNAAATFAVTRGAPPKGDA